MKLLHWKKVKGFTIRVNDTSGSWARICDPALRLHTFRANGMKGMAFPGAAFPLTLKPRPSNSRRGLLPSKLPFPCRLHLTMGRGHYFPLIWLALLTLQIEYLHEFIYLMIGVVW
jgi:hypothetical protein